MFVNIINKQVTFLGPELLCLVVSCRSVMEDHTDDSRYVLTQGKNSSKDWVARGANFMDNRLYDLAAHCYKVAEDAVRFTVATAFGKYMAVKGKKASMPSEYKQESFKVCSWAGMSPSAAKHAQADCPCKVLSLCSNMLLHANGISLACIGMRRPATNKVLCRLGMTCWLLPGMLMRLHQL